MLRCKISSSFNVLNNFQLVFFWLPNENTIRPNNKMINNKAQRIQMLQKQYKNRREMILSTVFKEREEEEREERKNYRFVPNEFPYDVLGNHWILWFKIKEESNLVINNIIERELQEFLKHNQFDFAWYENPKMTIPDIYHVQVFWIDFTSDIYRDNSDHSDGRNSNENRSNNNNYSSYNSSIARKEEINKTTIMW